MTARILIVDDEKNIRRTLRMVLEGEGWVVSDLERAEEAYALLENEPIDLVICDVRLPGMSGLELLDRVRKLPELAALPFVVISGHASVTEAIGALRQGATDFFEKPLDRERVLVTVRNALRTAAMARELAQLRAQVGPRDEMLGESAVMKRLHAEIEKVAPTRGRVLVTGESGTGKELIARAIHRLSPRADAPFVKVNCAAIPAELVESELFGHEKGAFTGAHGRKRGHFEAAHGGTLFLDEIGDMPLPAQSKVLRALQSGEITRVGSDQTITVDVRVVAATNRDLERDVADGRFREDLFFRLNVVPLRSPPLRERAEDIPRLVAAFATEFCMENGFKSKRIAAEVLDELTQRPFPGNVRELKNLVERMVILSGDEIGLDDVPDEPRLSREMRERLGMPRGSKPVSPTSPEDDGDDDETGDASTTIGGEGRQTLRQHRDAAERKYITQTLEELDWNISRAAGALGVERTNLHKKMRSLGIHRDA